jgi:hypothetical protein
MFRILPIFLITGVLLLPAGKADGQGVAITDDITALDTTTSYGTPTTVNEPGAGTSGFPSATTYSITYDSDVTSITGFSTVTGNYAPISYSGTITTTLDRVSDSAPDNNIVYDQLINQSGNSVTVAGPVPTTEQAAFNSNNLNVGTDNLFGNQGDTNNNNNNIERLDVVFNNGLTANNALGFAVIERGASNAHDGFKIAAITGISGGVPTSYGPLVSFATGSYGATALSPYSGTTNWLVSRDTEPNAPTSPSTVVNNQSLGGITISVTGSTSADGLGVTAGTTIYGYSLFGADVTGSGSQLVDYTDSTYFPQATSSTTDGGIDLIGYTGVAFTAVPEPRAYGLLPVLVLALIWFGRLLRSRINLARS